MKGGGGRGQARIHQELGERRRDLRSNPCFLLPTPYVCGRRRRNGTPAMPSTRGTRNTFTTLSDPRSTTSASRVHANLRIFHLQRSDFMDVSTLEVNVAIEALRRRRLSFGRALAVRCLLERGRGGRQEQRHGVLLGETGNRNDPKRLVSDATPSLPPRISTSCLAVCI